MLILGIVAVVLMLIICIAAVVHLLSKYSKAKDEAERQRLRAVVAENTARVASQQPIPGSGVDRSARPNPPEPPPNRTDTGRALTQPRPRPRPRQSAETSFDNLFSGLSEQMNQAFRGVSQAVSSVAEHATQLANTSTAIARDAQTLLNLGFTQEGVTVHQSRSWNLYQLMENSSAEIAREVGRLDVSNHSADHQNWGQLVREFMRMIESGELTFTENSSQVSVRTSPRAQQRGAESSPGTQVRVDSQARSSAKEPEPENLPPTRFEREDVI